MEPQQTLLSGQNKQLWRQLQIPVSPYFELTPRCTLDCKMCYVHLSPEQMGERRELSTEQWLRIADEAVEAGMLYVVLTGGECLLHPGFWEIYEHLLDKGVVVSVNTNAYTLTDADIERFRRRPPAAFRVTLYGASEEGYERCTGHRAYARVMENLIKLRDAGFMTAVAITVNRYNVAELAQMRQVVHELKLPLSYGLDLSEPNEDTGRHAADFRLSIEESVAVGRAILEVEGRPLHQNEPITEIPPRLPDDPVCKGVRCGAGATSYVIHWDGRMSPCFDFRNTIRVQDVGFLAAWEETKRLAQARLQPVECMSCRLLPVCATCFLSREDPRDPGHRDPERCRRTIARYNAGITTLQENASGDVRLMEDREEC